MSSLYSDPYFETRVDEMISKMFGPGVPLQQIVAWLEDRTDYETFCLTDIWAVLTTAKIMKQVPMQHPETCLFSKNNSNTVRTVGCCSSQHEVFVFQLELRHLSEEAERNATNPYPIYCAVERELTSQEPKKGTVTSTDHPEVNLDLAH